MQNDFDDWNTIKKQIHNKGVERFYSERHVWWVALGINIGDEENGKGEAFERPAVIVKGFNKNTCLIVPLTTSAGMLPYCLHVGKLNGQDNFALPYQIRCIDTKRLRNRVGFLDKKSYSSLRQSLRNFFSE